MAKPQLAIATCRDLPDWEVDDAPFHRALQQLDCDSQQVAWDDPTADWTAFDLCLIRTTWDYQERVAAFVRWAEQTATHCQLLNPVEVIRWNAYKTYLRDLAQTGVRVTPTRWLERGLSVDIAKELQSSGWHRAFLKPVVGATARETLRFDNSSADLARAQAHLDRLLPAEPMMLQPYLPSVESTGELSMICFDGRPSHAVRKVPVPGDYRVQDDFGASDHAIPIDAELRAATESVLAALQQRFPAAWPLLYTRIDWLRDTEGRLNLNELELIEPSLFFRHDPAAANRLATALLARCD